MLRLAANNFPAHASSIASGLGINQKPSNGMLAKRLEKSLCARAGPKRLPTRPGSLLGCFGLLIERMQNFVLLFGRQGRKPGSAREHLAHSCLHFRQACLIGPLVVTREGSQAAVDEINHSGFACSGRVVSRNDAGCDRINLRSLLGTEKFEFWRRGRLRGAMGVYRGGNEIRQK